MIWRWFWRQAWWISEALHIPLGRFAPWVFNQMMEGHDPVSLTALEADPNMLFTYTYEEQTDGAIDDIACTGYRRTFRRMKQWFDKARPDVIVVLTFDESITLEGPDACNAVTIAQARAAIRRDAPTVWKMRNGSSVTFPNGMNEGTYRGPDVMWKPVVLITDEERDRIVALARTGGKFNMAREEFEREFLGKFDDDTEYMELAHSVYQAWLEHSSDAGFPTLTERACQSYDAARSSGFSGSRREWKKTIRECWRHYPDRKDDSQ